MKDQPPIFFDRYQHPFGHTSGASEIILIDPVYRLVAGGETSPWTKPACDISPRGDIPKNIKKMVPLSHLRRIAFTCCVGLCTGMGAR
jgi:hypothetical protein